MLLTLSIFYFLVCLGGIFILPSSLFEIVNGFIFATIFNGKLLGMFVGFISYLFASSISAFITYKFFRFFVGHKLKELLLETGSNKTKIFDMLLNTKPFKILFFLRLSPILPTSIFNFMISAFECKIYFLF